MPVALEYFTALAVKTFGNVLRQQSEASQAHTTLPTRIPHFRSNYQHRIHKHIGYYGRRTQPPNHGIPNEIDLTVAFEPKVLQNVRKE